MGETEPNVRKYQEEKEGKVVGENGKGKSADEIPESTSEMGSDQQRGGGEK